MRALSDKHILYLGGVVIGGLIFIGYYGKKAVGAATDATVGAITGNNAITEGTPCITKSADCATTTLQAAVIVNRRYYGC